MNKTNIEYLDFISNPIVGCDMSLPCAERCWARRMAHRLKNAGVRQYQDVVDSEGNWTGKTAFNEAELEKLLRRREPAIIGLCYMGDCFHESVPDVWLHRLFAVAALTPTLRYLILTKRARRMRKWFDDDTWSNVSDAIEDELHGPTAQLFDWPLPNVALGVSCEDRASLHRLDDLRQTPAACRVLSAAPLLEDLGELNLEGIGWVIVEGETGSGARPMPPEWPRSIRDQCLTAGIPYFHKQNGEWSTVPTETVTIHTRYQDVPVGDGTHHRMFPVGKLAADRLLDGKVWDQRPEILK